MSANTPEFDALTAEGGNPLGGPRPDMTTPTFTINMAPTEWPDINEVLGPPPADPEATLEVAPVDLIAQPDANSALSLLDNGALPTSVTDLPAAEPLSAPDTKSAAPGSSIPTPGPPPKAIIDLSEFDEPGTTDRHAPRRQPWPHRHETGSRTSSATRSVG